MGLYRADLEIYDSKQIKYMRFLKYLWLAGIILFGCLEKKTGLRLNDIQIVGSHNSYKKAIDPELLMILYEQDSNLAITLDYEHLPLNEQLDLGMRNLELDVYHDPMGGMYSNPLGIRVTKTASNFDAEEMKKPGMKVFHVQDIDFRSHHNLFVEALQNIKGWSDQNPDHIPLIITMNVKDEVIDRENFIVPLPFTRNALDSVDMEILETIGWDKLITPDEVRGNYSELEEAILLNGWPLLEDVRGKILFILDAGQQINANYIEDHPSLKNRVMFVNVEEGNPEAAFRILNNPFVSFSKIQNLVSKGYMVRTRADANTFEARNNDYSRWKKANESGAQVITTDYYTPSTFFPSDYSVRFEFDSVYILNPVRVKQKEKLRK